MILAAIILFGNRLTWEIDVVLAIVVALRGTEKPHSELFEPFQSRLLV